MMKGEPWSRDTDEATQQEQPQSPHLVHRHSKDLAATLHKFMLEFRHLAQLSGTDCEQEREAESGEVSWDCCLFNRCREVHDAPGVNAFGWLNNMPQCSPSHLWKLISPAVLFCVKS
jgi:hypothetical protein